MDCTGLCALLVESAAMNQGLAQFLSLFVAVLLVSGIPLVTVILLIWIERKIAARIQDRVGPNRVGPFGLFQTFADLVKLMIKEDITPAVADRLLYNAAPIISFVAVVLIWAVIPFTPYHYGVDLDMAVLYFVAVASFGTLAIMIAGWASNNKYALLGAFRVVALLVSYEVPLVLALLVPVMLAGSMSLLDIIYAQTGIWFFFMAPLAAIIFFISSQAETGRAPFDLIEAESELVAGFNIEYSGMKFGMFFAGEFLHVFTNGFLLTIFFFGGWMFPGYQEPLLAFLWLGVKSFVLYFISLWIRNTVPRLRIDQVMGFNWKFLVPLSIANVLMTAFLLKVMQVLNLAPVLNQSTTLVSVLPMTVVLLLGNLALVAFVVGWLGRQGRAARLQMADDEQDELEEMAPAGAHGD